MTWLVGGLLAIGVIVYVVSGAFAWLRDSVGRIAAALAGRRYLRKHGYQSWAAALPQVPDLDAFERELNQARSALQEIEWGLTRPPVSEPRIQVPTYRASLPPIRGTRSEDEALRALREQLLGPALNAEKALRDLRGSTGPDWINVTLTPSEPVLDAPRDEGPTPILGAGRVWTPLANRVPEVVVPHELAHGQLTPIIEQHVPGRLLSLQRAANRAQDLRNRANVLDSRAEKVLAQVAERWEQVQGVYRQQLEKRESTVRARTEEYARASAEERRTLEELHRLNNSCDPSALARLCELVFPRLALPPIVPAECEAHWEDTERVLVINQRFPAPDDLRLGKFTKTGRATALSKTELKTFRRDFPRLLAIRLAMEAAALDLQRHAKYVVINGWCLAPDRVTGTERRYWCTSLMAPVEQLGELRLDGLEPGPAFDALRGRDAGETLGVIPLIPVLTLDRNDPRFVDSRPVLGSLQGGANLAAMDWQDFEHLIRELLEKTFAARGAEVRVTQASRDKGVDAVVLDPDPLVGGKTIIQAKRYTNTVEVSAVRDLYGTIVHEGANRGILITTSGFGGDAYDFAQSHPISLINGAQLLGLLEKHGYQFRIDLEEARLLARSGEPW